MQVREASIEWISLALQKHRPSQQHPETRAEILLEVAEHYGITVEATIESIKAENFEHHARAEHAMQQKRERDSQTR